MSSQVDRVSYSPLKLTDLAVLMRGADPSTKWRLVAEFLENYRWEPISSRYELVADEPPLIHDIQWDTFLGGLAEFVTARDNQGSPAWSQERQLERFWFPFNTPAARVDAFVHAPAAFRRRGIFISPQELVVV